MNLNDKDSENEIYIFYRDLFEIDRADVLNYTKLLFSIMDTIFKHFNSMEMKSMEVEDINLKK